MTEREVILEVVRVRGRCIIYVPTDREVHWLTDDKGCYDSPYGTVPVVRTDGPEMAVVVV